jgi:Holliday junction resolvase RusA-like endonuclease
MLAHDNSVAHFIPAIGKPLWVRAKKGMRKSDEYARWLTDAGWHVKAAEARINPRPLYKISLQATRPDRKRRDLDNLLKPVSDLLQSIGVIGRTIPTAR